MTLILLQVEPHLRWTELIGVNLHRETYDRLGCAQHSLIRFNLQAVTLVLLSNQIAFLLLLLCCYCSEGTTTAAAAAVVAANVEQLMLILSPAANWTGHT
jgi:hypothetical protein